MSANTSAVLRRLLHRIKCLSLWKLAQYLVSTANVLWNTWSWGVMGLMAAVCIAMFFKTTYAKLNCLDTLRTKWRQCETTFNWMFCQTVYIRYFDTRNQSFYKTLHLILVELQGKCLFYMQVFNWKNMNAFLIFLLGKYFFTLMRCPRIEPLYSRLKVCQRNRSTITPSN